ncbi:MAG: type toxin-antitoxin system HipA family toxin [Gemmatimonadetes bacterium]|nr:type toxin-antitoxin system HipA family toxin [Gemmatimonadota bacterium]
MRSPTELVALLDGSLVGHVRQDLRGRLGFSYDDGWRELRGAYPLSLSMPLARREHPDAVIRPYLEGLLPDNEAILARWGTRFQASPRNPFALLAYVGEDCPGAVQLVPPPRLAELRAGAEPPVAWLSEAQVGERLRELRTSNATGRNESDPGYFSLPGAQPKTALLYEDGRWGVPSGRTPTTHILKPPGGNFDGFAENEHLCLRLAAAVGLPATRSQVCRFAGEVAIVVERYDRISIDGRRVRVHQEDFCQALGISPHVKYEAEGGPGVAAMAEVLRAFSSAPGEDVDTLLGALALSWAIAGTDAHAKNYSLLIAGGQVRLAPLYDVASVLPYPERIPPREARLAMRIGREYSLRKIGRRHWERLGEEVGIGAEAALERVRAMVRLVPGALAEVCASARSEDIDHPVVARLESGIAKHAAACLAALDHRGRSADLP